MAKSYKQGLLDGFADGLKEGQKRVVERVRRLLDKEDFIINEGHDALIKSVAALLNEIEKGVQ